MSPDEERLFWWEKMLKDLNINDDNWPFAPGEAWKKTLHRWIDRHMPEEVRADSHKMVSDW